ncbi:integrase catalytic domain-containing protein [Trichonephila clavipes]|nr:integrase catalytic domain-containing protein [Trichonephila clavipes]
MGGLWEAGIKSVKYHLKRALRRSRLTYEEFETVIIQVEGILNSRPLTPISNDFDNFERGKWMIEKDNVMRGTMVIVKEDFTPVCNWLLGRVVEVYHGSDGKRNDLDYITIWTILSRRRTSIPLVRLVEGEERWKAHDHTQGVLPQNWGRTEQSRTVFCMVLKAKA